MDMIIGGRYTDKKLVFEKDRAFAMWCEHYHQHLQNLYRIFGKAGVDVDFDVFTKFVFDNSEKYISPYV